MYSVEILLLDDGFIDYCLNHYSPHKVHWDAVIAANPQLQHVFTEAKTIITTLGGGLTAQEIEKEVAKVQQQLQEENLNTAVTSNTEDNFSGALYVNNSGQLRNKMIKRIIFFSAAACVLLFCAIMFLKPSEGSSATVSNNNNIALRYNSSFGKRQEIKLPDGSEVVLNSNSSIVLDKDYNINNRNIQLTGEAFFKVAKDASKPFIVKSNDFATTAVGTAFYVHARNATQEYKVELLEGKVKLDAAKKTDFLLPGEDAEWSNTTVAFFKTTFDTSVLKNWLTGRISFNKTPLKDAVEKLEQWYAVDIIIKTKDILNQSVSGDYDNVSLEDILKVLCFTFSCTYIYANNTVTIE